MTISTIVEGISESGNIYATSINVNQYISNIAIVSAAGTTQATAALISSNVGITRLQGTTDGQATGYLLPSPTGNLGTEQILIYEGAVSANLWPNSGCKINALGANAAFALVANTTYYTIYSQASAYAVK